MLCVECGSQMRLTSEPIIEEYKGVSVTATNIEHYVCDNCGEYELGPVAADELSKQLVEGYAHARGLLTPAQIKEARKRLGMTQTEFESALGVSTPTASRWENGAMAPSKSVCKLIGLLLDEQRLARQDVRQLARAYEPEVHWRLFPSGWALYQGGGPKPSEPRYSALSTSHHTVTGFEDVREG